MVGGWWEEGGREGRRMMWVFDIVAWGVGCRWRCCWYGFRWCVGVDVDKQQLKRE